MLRASCFELGREGCFSRQMEAKSKFPRDVQLLWSAACG
jgi:hypothetical protein